MRDQVRGIIRNEKFLIEADYLLLDILGVDRSNVSRLNDKLRSTILKNRSVLSHGHIRSKHRSEVESHYTDKVDGKLFTQICLDFQLIRIFFSQGGKAQNPNP